MSTSRAILSAALALCAPGCAARSASTAGAGPGNAQEYTGQPFTVRQQGARLSGLVCGQDIQYTMQRGADGQTVLLGFLGTDAPSRLEVRQRGALRLISGSLGTPAGSAAVDLQLGPERLQGRVGFRYFDLRRAGDALTGPMRIAGTDDLAEATVQGVQAMWAMPEAAQAAVLANLLTCFVAPIGSYGRSPLRVGFGGPAGAQPRGSSSAPPL
jgi:hypothetical protein